MHGENPELIVNTVVSTPSSKTTPALLKIQILSSM